VRQGLAFADVRDLRVSEPDEVVGREANRFLVGARFLVRSGDIPERWPSRRWLTLETITARTVTV